MTTSEVLLKFLAELERVKLDEQGGLVRLNIIAGITRQELLEAELKEALGGDVTEGLA